MRFVDGVPHHLGYGATHPIAPEETLKLKEITYTHRKGIFGSEFKHGSLSAMHVGYLMALPELVGVGPVL